MTDNMRRMTRADIAFTNIGGLRGPINKGEITLGSAYTVFPFDNTLVTCDMTGAQVLEVLNYSLGNNRIGSVQFSGLKVEYAPLRADGDRVISVKTLDGNPLDADRYYKVATSNFMAAGGDGYAMIHNAKNTADTGITIRDSMNEEIIRVNKVAVTDDNRMKIVE